MSPYAGQLLVDEIMPIVCATVPRAVKRVGSEDAEELIADTLFSAARMLDAAESAGKPLIPKSVAYYSIQRTKSGRRALSATRTDAMAASTQLDGKSALESMDAPLAVSGEEGDSSLHDLLATTGEDPAMAAGRTVDWHALLASLGRRDRAIVRKTAEEASLGAMAGQFRVSPARVCQLRRELGPKIKALMGEHVLADAVRVPAWQSSLQVVREREACRWGRAQIAD